MHFHHPWTPWFKLLTEFPSYRLGSESSPTVDQAMDPFTPDQIYLHDRLALLGIVLLYYDYLLTFDNEVRHVWQKPKTSGVWLFYLNRYFPFLIGFVFCSGNFVEFRTIADCQNWGIFRGLAYLVIELIVSVVSVLRTYALYDRNRRLILCVLGATAFVAIAIQIWATLSEHSNASIFMGCNFANDRTSGLRSAGAWEALLAFDSLIFILTILKTYQNVGAKLQLMVSPVNGLMELVFRDGAIYFGVMACANAASIASFYRLSPVNRGALNTFSCLTSATMMSRMMLNMRQAAYDSKGDTVSGSSGTIRWAAFFTPSTGNQSLEDADHGSGNLDDQPELVDSDDVELRNTDPVEGGGNRACDSYEASV